MGLNITTSRFFRLAEEWAKPRLGMDRAKGTAAAPMRALASAKKAGVKVDPESLQAGLDWIKRVTCTEFGQVGYVTRGGQSARPEGLQHEFPAELSQAMTAAGLLVRALHGQTLKNEAVRKGTQLCLDVLPRWKKPRIDMYYWFLGTLALERVGGDPWKKWRNATVTALVPNQQEDGSWNPVGPWGAAGRVYSTALMAIALQTAGQKR